MSAKAVAITALVSVGATLACVAGFASREPRAVTEVRKLSDVPKLVTLKEIDPEDLGSRLNDSLATRRVTITNTDAKARVGLSVKHKSCGCTTVIIDKKSLGPGESTEVKLEINTGSAPGRLDASVVLEAATEGEGERRTQDVPIKATYVSASQLIVLPQYVMVREYIGEPFTRTIHLHPGACAEFKVTSAASDSPVLEGLTPTFTNKPEGGWTVTFRGTVPAKRMTAKVTIKTDCDEAAETFVSVLFDPVDPWQASPAGVSGLLEPGTTIEKTLKVVSKVGAKVKPATITMTDGIQGKVSASLVPLSSESDRFEVVVRVPPSESPTSLSGEITVSDERGTAIIVLPVGLYAPPVKPR
jgi:hypothetical protein